jgi:urease accessory protein UreE
LANANSASITVDGTTYSDQTVTLQGDSLIFPTLQSLGVTAEGAEATVSLAAGAVTNEDGLVNDLVQWTFTTFSKGPRVVSSRPADRATKVALTDSIIVIYNKTLTLVDASKIKLGTPAEIDLNKTITVSSDSLIIVFSGMLNATTYRVDLLVGALSDENNEFNAGERLMFRTIQTQPLATTIFPANGSNQIALDSTLSVRFDQAITLANANSASITIDGTTYSDQTVTLQGDSLIFPTLQSLGVTAEGAEATVSLAAGAVSNTDDLVNDQVQWTFRTFSPAPTLVSSSPANNATKVGLTDSIIVVYDKTLTLLDADKITVMAGDVALTRTVKVSSDSLIIVPSGMVNATTYSVSVGAGAIQDPNNQSNFGETFSFRTILTQPLATNIFPADGSTQIAFDSTMSVRFNQAITLANANSASITVVGGLFGALTVTIQGDSVIFPKLNSVIPPNEGALITLKLDAGAVKNGDDLFNEEVSWSYRTFSPAPALVSSRPVNNATKVGLTDSVILVYDKTLTLADESKITVKAGDNTLTSTIKVSSDSLIIVPSGMTNNVVYTVAIAEGALTNEFGIASAALEQTFRTIQTQPLATNILPVNGSTQIALNATLSVRFDQAITLANANSASITVDGTTYSDQTVTLQGDSLIFPTLQSLGVTAEGAEATVSLAAGAVSNEDDLVNAVISWTFTTYQPNPLVAQTFPKDDTTRVAIDAVIRFGFDQDVKEGDLTKFRLETKAGQAVSGAVATLNADTLEIRHNGLLNGVSYKAVVEQGVVLSQDDLPNLADSTSFRAIKTAPLVANLYPGDGSVGIGLDTTLKVRFDQKLVRVQGTAEVTRDGITTNVPMTLEQDSILTLAFSGFELETDYLISIPAEAVVNDDSLRSQAIEWGFKTVQPPAIMVDATPDSGAVNVGVSTTLTAGFDRPIVLSDSDGITITPAVNIVAAIEDESVLVITPENGLGNLTEYTVTIGSGAVQTTDGVSSQEYSWSFTTIVDLPEKVTLNSPADGLGAVSVTPTLVWENITRAETATLQISTEASFSTISRELTGLDASQEDLTTALKEYEAYYWRVQGVNTAGPGPWSDPFYFVTIAEAPQIVFPAISQTDISTAPEIQWSSPYTGTSFDFQLDADGSFTQLLEDKSMDSTSILLQGLSDDSEYFWRVRLRDDSTNSNWSERGVFTTRQDPVDTETDPVTFNLSFGAEPTTGEDGEPGEPVNEKVEQIDYRMVSLPGTDGVRLGEFFEGKYKKRWRAFIETGDPEEFYDEYSEDDQRFTFTPGLGFWVLSTEIVAGERTFTSVTTDENDSYGIDVHEGWNIIGNPYQSNIDWPLTLEFNDITGDLWGYDDGFFTTDTLKPIQGYYFYNDPGWNLDTLYLPYTGFDQRGQNKIAVEKLPDNLARLELGIAFTEQRTSQVRIILDDLAIYSADSDEEVPSRTVYEAVEKVHPNLDLAGKGMLVRNTQDDLMGWSSMSPGMDDGGVHVELEIKAEKGSEVTLMPKAFSLPAGTEGLLVNKVTQKPLRVDFTEPVTLKQTEPLGKYDVYIGDEAYLSEIEESLIPEQIELMQNYPNPFNPVTQIRYALPEASQVRLDVFDILGRKVKTLVNSQMEAGRHVIEFNASDLASGVYLYRLRSGSTVKVHKMTLIK